VLAVSSGAKRNLKDPSNGTYLQLASCASGSSLQQWDISQLTVDQTIRLEVNQRCIDIADYNSQNGALAWVWDCHTSDKDPKQQNQEFTWNTKAKTIVEIMSGRCLDSVSHSTASGSGIQLFDCSSSIATQQWIYNSADMSIQNVASGLCLSAGTGITNPCLVASNQGAAFCNTTLSAYERAADLVNRLSSTSKIAQLQNTPPSIPEVSMGAYQWWSEALHGVAGSPGVTFDRTTPYATSFPQVTTTGASFDSELFWAIGNAISTEARAFSNVGNAGLTFWAPNLNIFRDPRWGRGQETPGEDPYLSSQYVENFVRGMQFGTEDPARLKVSSCCKHYAAYSLENWEGMDRYHFDAWLSAQDLHDTYLPAFEACISPLAAGASGIMCSYNAVNGVPACADSYLLETLARNEWEFNGYITSDCGAVDCVINDHHYTNTSDQTCLAVLAGGMDIECGSYLAGNLQSAVNSGTVSWDLIDSHLINNFAVLVRLGYFDPPEDQPFLNITTDAINSPDHQALALTAAREGITLLKNIGNTLPLASPRPNSVAVLGPSGNATKLLQGNYYGVAPFLISPLAGIQSYVSDTTYVVGCAIAGTDESGFDAACQAAVAADQVVLVMGLDESQESEGLDRTIISWPGVQEQFIAKMASCAERPVILVVLSGGPIDLSAEAANPKIGAIIWAGYPGQAGGQAIADVLFGTYAPAGRLDHTWYPASFASQVSMEDMGMRPNATSGNPGRTYRFYTGTPVFPFGFGLSYTTWTFTILNTTIAAVPQQTLRKHIKEAGLSRFKLPNLGDADVSVTNTGSVTSDVSVLLFAVPPNAGQNGAPLRSLIAFKRLHAIQPGQSAIAHFPLTAAALSLHDHDGQRVPVVGSWKLQVEQVSREVRVF